MPRMDPRLHTPLPDRFEWANSARTGPDFAYCFALRTDAYRQMAVREFSTALRCHEFRSIAKRKLTTANIALDVFILGSVRLHIGPP